MSDKIELDSYARYFTVKPIILVTTLGPRGLPNVAPKTQCMDIGRREECFAFVCVPEHHTYQNVKTNGEFVVNYPKPELVKNISAASQHAENVDEMKLAGLTSIPSLVVKPPRIKECPLHLECKLIKIIDIEVASVVIGKIVTRSASREVSFELGEARRSIDLLKGHPLLAYVHPAHYTKISVAEEFVFPRNYKP